MTRRCVECGVEYDRRQTKHASELWCPKCDVARIARIDRQLKVIQDGFKAPKTREELQSQADAEDCGPEAK